MNSNEKEEFLDIINDQQGFIRLNTQELGEKKILMSMINQEIDDKTIEKLCGIISKKGETDSEE